MLETVPPIIFALMARLVVMPAFPDGVLVRSAVALVAII